MDLQAVKARLATITSGTWEIEPTENYIQLKDCPGFLLVETNYDRDMLFIVAAPTDIAALVKRVEELESALKTIAYNISDVGILFDGHDELNDHTHKANAQHMEGALDRINEIALAILAGKAKE